MPLKLQYMWRVLDVVLQKMRIFSCITCPRFGLMLPFPILPQKAWKLQSIWSLCLICGTWWKKLSLKYTPNSPKNSQLPNLKRYHFLHVWVQSLINWACKNWIDLLCSGQTNPKNSGQIFTTLKTSNLNLSSGTGESLYCFLKAVKIQGFHEKALKLRKLFKTCSPPVKNVKQKLKLF